MTAWRPAPTIRVKALGLIWRNGLLLASEITRDDGSLKGVRPLGGGVEFGEPWRDALVREFREELGLTVTLTGDPIVLENIYTHHGVTGHEIIFVTDVLAPDHSLQQDRITYVEDNGTRCHATWYDIDTLDQGGLALYPNGLKDHLIRRRARG